MRKVTDNLWQKKCPLLADTFGERVFVGGGVLDGPAISR